VAAALARYSTGSVELAGQLADLGANGAGRPGVLVAIDQADEASPTRTTARHPAGPVARSGDRIAGRPGVVFSTPPVVPSAHRASS